MSRNTKTKKILASEKVALWSLNKKQRISDLVVISYEDHTDEMNGKYDSWGGYGSKKWNEGDFRTKPIGLFAQIASRHGFSSSKVARKALKEFAKVKGQRWARLTISAIDEELI
ncbi:hypothetical protein LRS73_31815 [Methylobacterium currus]|uniref:hypothetical protein n=1 Tax=Methylobacterium currus TaxID=2051553 RepID=UPI001E3743BE|nr:hypothetical protein [Methylobacterium currus]UHC19445.1 hypothetical protein LRS73_31815 [Methylobacterium currus]